MLCACCPLYIHGIRNHLTTQLVDLLFSLFDSKPETIYVKPPDSQFFWSVLVNLSLSWTSFIGYCEEKKSEKIEFPLGGINKVYKLN